MKDLKIKYDIAYYKSPTREVKTVDWPGTSKQINVMLLNCGEQQKAAFETQQYFDRMRIPLDNDITSQQYNYELAYQLCFLALIYPDSKRHLDRVFRSVDELKKSCTEDEVNYFIEKQKDFQREALDRMNIIDGPTDPHLRCIAKLMDVAPEESADVIVDVIRQRLIVSNAIKEQVDDG